MHRREKSPSRPENRLLLAEAVSLFYQGCTHRQISDKLGLSMNITHRYLRQRSLLDPEKLDPKAQEARERRLEQLEDQLAHSMPAALAGNMRQAKVAIAAIKARCHLLGLGLHPQPYPTKNSP
jgi:hypothetical protein